jgi:hypothetical protein
MMKRHGAWEGPRAFDKKEHMWEVSPSEESGTPDNFARRQKDGGGIKRRAAHSMRYAKLYPALICFAAG